MNRLDAIRLIGDVITEIDVLKGSLLPDDPRREKLNDCRLLLDERQQRLARSVIDDNTDTFQTASAKLKTINARIDTTLDDLDRLDTTLKSINTFITAVTSLLSAVALFA